ncbi:DUF6248 family natural product biosynthesis protein [Nocardiopsis synnemataformans]|uniref:DUF6248 family natural product biosynthesis protein n=1 Tax=Nocardiopsis synnemataformans TaxID=61305 RepID=UPI003EB8F592
MTAARAQRILTEDEWAHVRRTPHLRLIGSLIMGIVDPVDLPSPLDEPMSEEDAAWVREHAWTPGLRAIERVYPWGFHRWCSCQRGTCWNCLNYRCDICVHRQLGGAQVDTGAGVITTGAGYVAGELLHHEKQAPCRWLCRCPCDKTSSADPAPEAAPPDSDPEPRRPARGRRAMPSTATPLFDLEDL